MECNHEEDLERQAVIIDNQEELLVTMQNMQATLVDLLVPMTDRMTDEEKKKYLKASSDLEVLRLRMKSIADQAKAARVAYGIESE